ncbi:PhoH family protein [Aquibacillus kalidii]|uniref:PhoH family protein n=1 Tax=Aquibacillus kalidii TaxID=2762597 RepID=UPI00164528C2|nr:PhoH family protein [Aquibacillus kalidii]
MVNRKNYLHENHFELQLGKYLLLLDYPDPNTPDQEKATGAWKWDGQMYRRISMEQRFHSSAFPEVRRKDFQQAIVMDSLTSPPLTTITGPTGVGKSYLSFAYMMQQLEYQETQIYIVTNNVPLRGSKTFGLKKVTLNIRFFFLTMVQSFAQNSAWSTQNSSLQEKRSI